MGHCVGLETTVNEGLSLLSKISSQKYVNCTFKYNIFQQWDIWAFNRINCQFFSNITVMCKKMTTELNESVKAQMMGNHVETISLCLVITQRTDTVSLSLHNEMWQLQKLILHWKEDEKWVKLNFKPFFFNHI